MPAEVLKPKMFRVLLLLSACQFEFSPPVLTGSAMLSPKSKGQNVLLIFSVWDCKPE